MNFAPGAKFITRSSRMARNAPHIVRWRTRHTIRPWRTQQSGQPVGPRQYRRFVVSVLKDFQKAKIRMEKI